jgi:hypothetical protein
MSGNTGYTTYEGVGTITDSDNQSSLYVQMMCRSYISGGLLHAKAVFSVKQLINLLKPTGYMMHQKL